MDAVMCIERASGHVPMDVSRENCGWDVESRVMREDGIEDLLFIESKGVAADADTVILTRNEICKAMGNPHNYIVAISRPNNDGVETSYVHADFGDVYNEMMSMYPLKIDKLIESANNVATYFIKDGVCTKRS